MHLLSDSDESGVVVAMALFLSIEPETLETVKGIFLNSYSLLQGAYYLSPAYLPPEKLELAQRFGKLRDELNAYYLDCFKKYDIPVNFKDGLVSERTSHPFPSLPKNQEGYFLNTIVALYSKKREKLASISRATLVERLREPATNALHDLAASRYMVLKYNEDDVAARIKGPFTLLLSARKFPLEAVLLQMSDRQLVQK